MSIWLPQKIKNYAENFRKRYVAFVGWVDAGSPTLSSNIRHVGLRKLNPTYGFGAVQRFFLFMILG